jgi:hypothetical protein
MSTLTIPRHPMAVRDLEHMKTYNFYYAGCDGERSKLIGVLTTAGLYY